MTVWMGLSLRTSNDDEDDHGCCELSADDVVDATTTLNVRPWRVPLSERPDRSSERQKAAFAIVRCRPITMTTTTMCKRSCNLIPTREMYASAKYVEEDGEGRERDSGNDGRRVLSVNHHGRDGWMDG